jgi:alpha-1,6-mannosyltransferase
VRSATIAVASACTLALALAVLASRHARPAEVSPVVPHGGWNAVWVASLVAALGLYGAGAALARFARVRIGVVLVFAVAMQVVPLAAPLLLSKDLFLYWNEGRTIVTYSQDPYTVTPDAHPADPSFPRVSEEWRASPAPYGPAFEGLTTVPAVVTGASPRHAVVAFRVLAILGVLAAIGIVAWSTRSAAATAFLGWNPLIALHFAGGGHSDAWMVALLVLAVAARNRAAAGAAWPLAAAFKAFPVVLLPLELARTRFRVERRFWVSLAVTSAVIAAISLSVFGTGWLKGSLVGAHVASPLGGVHWLTETGLRHRYAVLIGAGVFAAIYVVLLRSAWRTGRARLSLATTALCMTTSLLRPWYGLWPVALAAAEEDVGAAVAAFALTAYLLLGDAVSF